MAGESAVAVGEEGCRGGDPFLAFRRINVKCVIGAVILLGARTNHLRGKIAPVVDQHHGGDDAGVGELLHGPVIGSGDGTVEIIGLPVVLEGEIIAGEDPQGEAQLGALDAQGDGFINLSQLQGQSLLAGVFYRSVVIGQNLDAAGVGAVGDDAVF